MDWMFTLSGFVVGLIVGVTGVGGGSLMTPLLVLFFGVSPATAVGTDLLYASLTKTVGAWVHSRRGTVDWKVVGLLSLGSLPAALVTILLLKYLALDEKSLRTLVTGVLSAALLLTAVVLLFKQQIMKVARRSEGNELHHRYLPAATLATGVIVGALVTPILHMLCRSRPLPVWGIWRWVRWIWCCSAACWQVPCPEFTSAVMSARKSRSMCCVRLWR
jgi:uncharacterized membrane protein YfcA